MTTRHAILAGMLMLFACTALQAQRSINLSDHLLIKTSDAYLYGGPDPGYEGSPYMTDDFVTTTVYTGTLKLDPLPMRYNIFANVMEFRQSNETFLLEADPRITRIEMGDRIFVVEDFKLMGKKQPWFMELLEPGKLTLLAKNSVAFRKKVEINDLPAKYSRSADVYYCRIGDQDLVKVGNMKDLIGSLPDKQQEVTQFAKEQKLSAKDKDDLVKLARYYNSLFANN
ncbi:MAG TPA: hypothetical protein VF490_11275 [Chryseosolibacter sp.]